MFGYSDTAAIATDPSTGNTLNLCLDYVAFDVTTALTGERKIPLMRSSPNS